MRISDWSSDVCSSDLAFQLRPGAHALARREAGHQHRALELLALADPDPPLVELRAGATGGGEQLVAQRVEDHRVLRLAIPDQGDRPAPVRPAVEVRAGAVGRVETPGGTRRRNRAADG